MGGRDVTRTHTQTGARTNQGRTKRVHRKGRVKRTQPGKEKGHPQTLCGCTTVSDISLAKQSGMDVCFQDFGCLSDSRSFPVGSNRCPAPLFFFFSKSLLCSQSTSPTVPSPPGLTGRSRKSIRAGCPVRRFGACAGSAHAGPEESSRSPFIT